MAASQATICSMLPALSERALQRAISSFDEAELATPAGRERVVRSVARSIAAYEERMLPPGAHRMDPARIEAIVRVAMRGLVAACA